MRDHLSHLLAHAAWADAQFFAAWAESQARDDEELRRRAAHVADVQRAFRSLLAGGPPVIPPTGQPLSLDELKDGARLAHNSLGGLLAGLDDAGLAVTVRLPWFPDPPCLVSVAEGLTQVALHTQHHRGQLMTRLKDHGGAPRNVDYVIWLWKGRPTADWS